MGIRWSNLRLGRKKRIRVLILGLDAAGKTTILYQFKSGRSFDTIPTIGFNVEQVMINGVEYTFWDVGGQDKLRLLWKHYYSENTVLMYTVDSTYAIFSRERISESKDALAGILMDPIMDECVLLVYANKQDMPNAMSGAEVADKLDLTALTDRVWHIQPSCALTGDGLYEGLAWARKNHKKTRKKLGIVKMR